MQIEAIVITYKSRGEDKSDTIYAHRLKFRRRAKLFAEVERQLPAGVKNDDGTFNFKDVPKDVMADFVVAIITDSMCTQEGKPCVTPDEIDDWEDSKRGAYFTKLLELQNPKTEEIAKKSSSTPSAGS